MIGYRYFGLSRIGGVTALKYQRAKRGGTVYYQNLVLTGFLKIVARA